MISLEEDEERLVLFSFVLSLDCLDLAMVARSRLRLNCRPILPFILIALIAIHSVRNGSASQGAVSLLEGSWRNRPQYVH